MKENSGNVKTDINSLRELVKIDIKVSSIQWEIFGTPEYSGGVPGPMTTMTLIAEIQSSEGQWFENQHPATGEIYIVPEAARSWLSPTFKSMMMKLKNSSVDMTKLINCKQYETTFVKTGNPVSGINCKDGDRYFIYLPLLNN